MNIVVTGGSGFVGGRLIAALAAHADDRVTGVSRRLPAWRAGAVMISADLTRPSRALREALRGADAVVHLAGANEVAARADPALASAETLAAAHTVIAEAREADVTRLVYVSTVHVYGAALAPGRVVSERVNPEPLSPYATARLAVERLLTGNGAGPEIVIFRLSNCVGAPVDGTVDRWTLVANDLCRQAVSDGALRLATSGTQWRDFVSLRDVVDILCRGVHGSFRASTYNLASGHPVSVLALARMVQQVASDIGLAPIDLRAPEPSDAVSEPYRIDVSKLAAAGATTTTPLAIAVEETLRFCVAHREELKAHG